MSGPIEASPMLLMPLRTASAGGRLGASRSTAVAEKTAQTRNSANANAEANAFIESPSRKRAGNRGLSPVSPRLAFQPESILKGAGAASMNEHSGTVQPAFIHPA